MTTKKTAIVTGASKGIGAGLVSRFLEEGYNVVGTSRSVTKSTDLTASSQLALVDGDIGDAPTAQRVADTAIERFGRIDVLVNNAASFYAGYFEELTPGQMELQLATSLTGPMNVTRAFLPAMRRQRSGKIISISSSAGLTGFEYCTAYSASKFGLEGWMEALQAEVEPFGIHTMTVNPGFFRTELLTEESTNYAKPTIEDYKERNAQQHEFWKSQNGKQSGDPAKLARALITLANQKELPRRFIAGADAIGTAEQKVALLQQQINAYRDLSGSLAYDVA